MILKVKEAAIRLGVSELQLRKGIEQGQYPFGVVIRSKAGKRNQYPIIKERFEKYLAGEL